jgi:hypothetical protein
MEQKPTVRTSLPVGNVRVSKVETSKSVPPHKIAVPPPLLSHTTQ